ncbi:hypothetical protein [Methanorbis furvi]|uniref:CARDB domain-containing protein n=1 Tax=Methanorbis furvi TaxID=3028299 RepID=A0AAE4MCH2_9EURY|nr:hypothetical protein [Methanocorpusculaceae archaeon Ag1]
MKFPHTLLIGALVLFLLVTGGLSSAAAEETGQVSVISLTMDPEVLMPGDTATITAVIKNSGTTSVSIGRALIMGVNEVYSPEAKAYNSVGMLGPGDEMTFTFPITSRGQIGTYYPMLYLDFLNAGLSSLKYTFAVRVDDTQLSVALIDQPDAFGESRNEKVTVRVGNPRANSLNGIQISVSGDGVSSKQTTYFVGKLDPDQYVDANLTVVVDKPTDISFDVSYRNGQNLHTNSVQIPVSLGERKVRAEMILNNIEIANKGTYYQVTGDVNNAGLEDAKSIIVTTAKATPVAPMESYVVGSLEPDGIAEFDVTFTNPESNVVDLLVSYKDADGNQYQSTVQVTLSGAVVSGNATSSDESPAGAVAAVVVILLIGVCAVVAWRRGLLTDLRKK